MKKEIENNIEKYKKEKISFEDALFKLENIIAQLENSEIQLNESLKIYEEGISLGEYCEGLLKEAEGKWSYIKESNGKFIETPIDKESLNLE